jgi:xanthine dehydrogenase accessory factor
MQILRRCLELLDAGRSAVLVTVVQASRSTPGKEGFKLLLADDGSQSGTVGGGAVEHRALEEARQVMESGGTRLATYDLGALGMECGGQVTLLFEHFQGGRGFFLFGGGHVNRALAPLLESLGFRVTVFDSRPEIRAQWSEQPERRLLVGDYAALQPLLEQMREGDYSFIATHGHEHDYTVLSQLLRAARPLAYIGLIGSRSKVRATMQKLAAEGLSVPEQLYAPVGLRIGGDTPAEIAVSIAAEVVAVRNGVTANHMRLP